MTISIYGIKIASTLYKRRCLPLLSKLTKESNKGFTLIELLIVVAIIGIIAAIAVPSLLSAIQRTKQKRTMADIRYLGTALETYHTDFNKYPQSGIANLTCLEPNYMRYVNSIDGWGYSLHYVAFNVDQDYSLGSGGRDGSIPAWSLPPQTTTSFDDDIIFFDGQFMVYPEGVQT
jgi:type II secretion system protein G